MIVAFNPLGSSELFLENGLSKVSHPPPPEAQGGGTPGTSYLLRVPGPLTQSFIHIRP